MALAGCHSPTLVASSCLRAALLIGLFTSAPSAKASRASSKVIVLLNLLQALCMALVLFGSMGEPPLARGIFSSITVQSSAGHAALGLSGPPQSEQCVAVALILRVSSLRRCPFRWVPLVCPAIIIPPLVTYPGLSAPVVWPRCFGVVVTPPAFVAEGVRSGCCRGLVGEVHLSRFKGKHVIDGDLHVGGVCY